MRRKQRIMKLRKLLREEVRLMRKHRKKRTRKPKKMSRKKMERMHNLLYQRAGDDRTDYYAQDHAKLIALFMTQIKERVKSRDGVSFIQQYYLTKGLKIFGDKGRDAAMKELQQLVERNCWEPKLISELTAEEKRKAVDSMMLLAEKNDGSVKGRHVFKGSESRDWLTREETSSPTASQEGIMTTCVIDAHEERDMMSLDIPNAFIQTLMPEVKDGEARVTMKITGLLVDYLIAIDATYRDYVVTKNGKRVIYVVILRAIYGMLVASLLFYKKIRADFEDEGFIFNPYDPCIANKMVNGKQQTIRFHVDDLMSKSC